MTLILSVISNRYALQVSDRLITRNGHPFDPIANKTVVLFGLNGVVTLGYSGPAYVARTPIDQWLVEQITGVKFGEKPPDFMAPAPGKIRDIGRMLERVRAAAGRVYLQTRMEWRNQWREQEFGISVVGFQWKGNGRGRPLLARISKDRGEVGAELRYRTRHWEVAPREKGVKFSLTAEGQADRRLLKRIAKDLKNLDEDHAESVLVEAIREIAGGRTTVGEDCLSVFIGPPNFPEVRTRYLPHTHFQAVMKNDHGTKTLETGFRPWIVAPGLLMAPGFLVGGSGMRVGRYRLFIDAPESDSGILWLSSSQKRRKPY